MLILEALFEREIWYRVYNQNVEVNLVLVPEEFQPVRVKNCIKERYKSLSTVWCFHLIERMVKYRAHLLENCHQCDPGNSWIAYSLLCYPSSRYLNN